MLTLADTPASGTHSQACASGVDPGPGGAGENASGILQATNRGGAVGFRDEADGSLNLGAHGSRSGNRSGLGRFFPRS